MAPTVAGDQHNGANATFHDPSCGSFTTRNSAPLMDPRVKSAIGTSSTISIKETENDASSLTEAPIYPEGSSMPPPEAHIVTTGKNSSTKGKEVPSSAHDESGYVLLSSMLWFVMATLCAPLIS